MPQKPTDLFGLHHGNRSAVASTSPHCLDAMIEDHERSTGPWEIEWIAVRKSSA